MAATKDTIIVGAATSVTLNAVDIGSTKDGVTLIKEDTFFDKTADQVKGKLDKVLTDRRIAVRFTLQEVSVANLHRALNLAAGDLSASTISITQSEAALVPLVVVGPAQFAGTRTISLDFVRNIASLESTFAKGDNNAVPMECEAMYNPANNRFGTIVN